MKKTLPPPFDPLTVTDAVQAALCAVLFAGILFFKQEAQALRESRDYWYDVSVSEKYGAHIRAVCVFETPSTKRSVLSMRSWYCVATAALTTPTNAGPR